MYNFWTIQSKVVFIYTSNAYVFNCLEILPSSRFTGFHSICKFYNSQTFLNYAAKNWPEDIEINRCRTDGINSFRIVFLVLKNRDFLFENKLLNIVVVFLSQRFISSLSHVLGKNMIPLRSSVTFLFRPIDQSIVSSNHSLILFIRRTPHE